MYESSLTTKNKSPLPKRVALAFQELEWHSIDDIDFDDVENDIPEINHGPGTHVLTNIEPVWMDA